MFATPAYAQRAGVSATILLAAVMFAPSAYAQAAGAGQPESPIGNLAPFGMIVLMFVLMYFLVMRPQQKRAKEHQAMVSAVKRGDTVVLSNGMVGKVTRVEDAEAMVEIASGVNTRVIKAMIAEVRTRGEPAANDAKS